MLSLRRLPAGRININGASSFCFRRNLTTLSEYSHIYVHPQPDKSSLLSLLSTSPPNSALAIGTTKVIPPTPDSLVENPKFLQIVHSVIKQYASQDPEVQAQAQAFSSNAGSTLGSGGALFPSNHPSRAHKRSKRSQFGSGVTTGGDGAGGASSQGGAGGGGRGGWIHVSDQRNPPDFGRIAWPEDIFGSLEVDNEGKILDGQKYQESGTYRVITREGILGLSPFLRGKLLARLKEME